MRISRRLAIALAAAPVLPTAAYAAPQATAPADAPLVQLVKDFIDAERQYDQKRIADLITDDYVEISPIGEVDPRAKFLGFYAADKKRDSPLTTIGAPMIRHYGNAASIIVRLSVELPTPTGPRSVAVQATYLAIRSGSSWKLASTQYTAERPKPTAPPAK